MFGVYHEAKEAIAASRGVAPGDLGVGDNLLAGFLGGNAFWLACLPADVVKSKIQTDSRYGRGVLEAARKVVAAEGLRGLYRGFGPAMLRAGPANAVCFAAYEAVSAALRGSGNGGGGSGGGSGGDAAA